MANYLPPTEDLPIFDDSVFEVNNSPLTYNEATQGFLTFPFAQGNETFQDIIVDGTTDFFNQVDNHSTMPPFSNSSTIVPTTQWVQGAIQNNPPTTVETLSTSSATPLAIPLLSTSVPGVADLLVDSSNGLTYTPSTDTLTVTNITGTVSTAIDANNLNLTLSPVSASRPVILGTSASGYNACLTSSGIFANPATNTLTATTFSGNATSATTSTNVALTIDNSASQCFIPFSKTVSTTSNILYIDNSPVSLTYQPSSGTLSCSNFNGLASSATTSTNVALTSDNTLGTYYLPFSKTTSTTSNALYIDNTTGPLTYVPSTGTLSTVALSATTSTLSPLYNTTSGGTVRLTGSTGQFSGLQQSSAGFGYDLNLTLPNQGAFNILTGSFNYVPPAGPNTTTSGLGIGYNASGTTGETDFVNYAGNNTTGGYNYYTLGTNATTLIGTLPRVQPAYSDSSVNLPTTAWVQGAIANSGLYLPYYNYKAYGISTNVLTQTTQNIIINIPQSEFTSANCALPWKAVKVRFVYSIYDSTGAIAYSNNGILNILPMNIVTTNASPITPVYATVGTGGVTNNIVPNSQYSFNITNGMSSVITIPSPFSIQQTAPTFNYLSTYYADGYTGEPLRNRWYWVSNQNGGMPSGFGGVSAWFNYLNYSYNGAGQFTIGMNTPPYNSSPNYQGPPGWTVGGTLDLNVLFELVSNDFTGSSVTFSSI